MVFPNHCTFAILLATAAQANIRIGGSRLRTNGKVARISSISGTCPVAATNQSVPIYDDWRLGVNTPLRELQRLG